MRYLREVRWRFVGPPEKCQNYTKIARTLVGELANRDIELGGLSQSVGRWELPDGTRVSVNVLDPIPIVTIDTTGEPVPEDDFEYTARLVWMPQGIVLTPVSVLEPDGRGLPHRQFDTGEVKNPPYTVGGRLPQLMLNKYVNNAYLDKGDYIEAIDENGQTIRPVSGENLRLRDDPGGNWDSLSLQYESWHLLYQPLDCGDDPDLNGINYWTGDIDVPGLYQGDEVAIAQFQPPYAASFVYEPKSVDWYTHRPEEALYYYEGYEGCFQYTNVLRVNTGNERVFRPLRGRGDIAFMAVTEVARIGKQYHEHPDFQPGKRNQTSRAAANRAAIAVGENLYIGPQPPGTLTDGEDVAKVWEASPNHYPNMVSTIYDEENWGCEHYIASIAATVDETESLGTLPTPISGNEWSQQFVLGTTWVPCPQNFHDGTPHVIGNWGKMSDWDRMEYYTEPNYFYISWGQVLIAVPQNLLPDPAYALIGCAFYQVDGELPRFRAVIACGDQGVNRPGLAGRPEHYDFTMAVITTEVPTTGKSDITIGQDTYEVTGACRWEVEATYDFTNADEWIASPPGQVKFSPDGTKFVFTMNQIGNKYPSDRRYLDTGLVPHSPVPGVMQYCDVRLYRIEYDSKYQAVPGGPETPNFDLDETLMPIVSVSHDEVRNPDNSVQTFLYTRQVNGSFPAFWDYDENNNLIYASVSVDEFQICSYPSAVTSCRRERKVIFPSGKEVVYVDEDLSGHRGTNEFLTFYYLNVRTEDCVFSRRKCADAPFRTQRNIDNGLPLDPEYVYYMFTGEFTIEVDLGTLQDREFGTIWSDGVGVATAFFNNNGNGINQYSHDFEQPRYTYQAGTTPAVYFVGLNPVLCPTSQPYITNRSVAPRDNGTLLADYVNSILLEDHKLNFMPGITNRVMPPVTNPPYSDADVLFTYFRQLYASGDASIISGQSVYDMGVTLRQASVAPVFVPEPLAATCQLVRYDERVIVRLEHTIIPWRNLDVTYGASVGGVPVIDRVDVNWHTIDPDDEVMLWSNFDLDAATGMSDVTDIAPFGRVG